MIAKKMKKNFIVIFRFYTLKVFMKLAIITILLIRISDDINQLVQLVI